MKILVTGASGLVGYHVIQNALRRGHEVIAHTRGDDALLSSVKSVKTFTADLSNLDRATQIFLDHFPEAIVNAAAASSPAKVEADPEHAEVLNVQLPERLAEIANHLSAQLIHFSTDMVFNGFRQRGPYLTSDAPDPQTKYGQQKMKGEKAALEAGGYHVTVLRIPIQLGNSPRGQRSVHENLLQQLADGKTPELFTDEIRQPCQADNTAEVCVELLERGNLHGIFHWGGAETLSRYEMGVQLMDLFGLPREWIKAARAEGHPEHARRPRNLTLDLHPLSNKLRTQPQPYEQQLEDLSIPQHLREWYHQLQ